MRSDLVDVFASFTLLSYSKILYQIILTFDSEEITNYSLMDGKEIYAYVLRADLTIFTLQSSDGLMIVMTCFLGLLVALLIFFPVFLLFFYPTKILRKLLSKCLNNRLLIFLNTSRESIFF